MKLSDFDYKLPKDLIAQEPLKDRSSSKLMVVKDKTIHHKHFKDILGYLEPGDVLVLNETRVEPVRLKGRKVTGAKAEFIVSKKINSNTYQVQIKTHSVKIGGEFLFNHDLKAKVLGCDGMNFIVRFNKDDIEPILRDIGEMPLPTYIKKHTDNTKKEYQTVYAKYSGSIAAPTAGFHFTPELLKKIEKKGIKIAKITLHIGYGTFLPVRTEDIKGHKMHSEWFRITKKAAETINSRRGRLVCVGTTSLRALESAAAEDRMIYAQSKETDIFIYPGHDWRSGVDMLITNFHLPKTTLLMLVSAFTDQDMIKKAYQEAIKEGYRFFSFGDSMLLYRRDYC